MQDFQPISEAPHGVELLLWLEAEEGDETPIGWIIGSYKTTSMGEGWTEKSASGNINTGLRADLITHFCHLEDGPDDMQ